MPNHIKHLALVILLMVFVSSALAEPQPRFVSGKMETGTTVTIFGAGFGEAVEGNVPSKPGPSSVQPAQGVVAGDDPSWETCTKYHSMPLLEWSAEKIVFRFEEGSLPPLEPFYLFVVEAGGMVSAAIGPWRAGEGLTAVNDRVPLNVEGNILVPAFKVEDEGAPGRPGTPSIRLAQ